MFKFLIIVLTLLILQLLICKYIKNQINKMIGKIELLKLKNTRFYGETKLLEDLNITEVKNYIN